MPEIPLENDCLTTFHPQEKDGLVLFDFQTQSQVVLRFGLERQPGSIGRDPHTDLVLMDPSISRRHCRVRQVTEDTWAVEDLASSNGTFVNGEKVRRAEIHPGDILQLGSRRFRVEDAVGTENPMATHNLLMRLFQSANPAKRTRDAA